MRVQARGAGAAVAAPQHVAAHDEVPRRVERLAGAEQVRPPLLQVRGTGEGVADQHGVVAGRVEPAPGAVGHRHLGQGHARLQLHRLRQCEEPRLVVERQGLAHAAALARSFSKAWAKSALMSSMCSMPTDTRMRSGVTPAERCSSAVSCWWVVELGWITRVLASPTLARWLASFTLSMKPRPAASPPRMPKLSTAP